MGNVVFMHTGPETEFPTIFARSVRRHNPAFRIWQVTDPGSPAIAGVDEVVRFEVRDRKSMLFRMRCFAALKVEGPAWYLDTDMICLTPLAFEAPAGMAAALCQRQFDTGVPLNINFRGMDMREHANKTLGEVYPYIGCATLVHDHAFWPECLREMEALDTKYYEWYGDQEALRNVAQRGTFKTGLLPERTYACLPEYETPAERPQILHFKGARKRFMAERAQRESLI